MMNKYLMVLIGLIIQTKAPFPIIAYNYYMHKTGNVIEATLGGYYDEDDWECRDPGNLESTTRELMMELGDELDQEEMKKELSELFNNELSQSEVEKLWNLFYNDASGLSKTMMEKDNQKRINKEERESRIKEALRQIQKTTDKESLNQLNNQINKIRVEGEKTLGVLNSKRDSYEYRRENRILKVAIFNRIHEIKNEMNQEKITEKYLRRQLGIYS